ncbi:hypothetical protein ACFFLM_23470, partial [Deinococcus oregonensis]
WAWTVQRRSAALGQVDAAYLAGSLAGGATAGTTSVLSAAAVALLGSNTRLLGFAGLGAALTSVGLAAHNRRWAQGGIALASVSVTAALVSPYLGGPAAPRLVVLLALAGFWVLAARLSQRGWKEEARALSFVTGASMAILAYSGLLEAAWFSVVAGAALWAVQSRRHLEVFRPLTGGLALATVTSSALVSAFAFRVGAGLSAGDWAKLILAIAGAALALLASRAVASPVQAVRTATPAPDSHAVDALVREAAEPQAPTLQTASWSVLAFGLAAAIHAAGALNDEAAGLTLSVMALVT